MCFKAEICLKCHPVLPKPLFLSAHLASNPEAVSAQTQVVQCRAPPLHKTTTTTISATFTSTSVARASLRHQTFQQILLLAETRVLLERNRKYRCVRLGAHDVGCVDVLVGGRWSYDARLAWLTSTERR